MVGLVDATRRTKSSKNLGQREKQDMKEKLYLKLVDLIEKESRDCPKEKNCYVNEIMSLIEKEYEKKGTKESKKAKK